MSIQWFPGHMHLTKKAIIERMKDTDVVIEMLDARLPGSSANPLLAELTAGKPALKVLNKQDLADPHCTALWLNHYTAHVTTAVRDTDKLGAPAAVKTTADITGAGVISAGVTNADIANSPNTPTTTSTTNGTGRTNGTSAASTRAPMLAISLDASDGAPGQRMVQACRELAPHRGTVVKPLRVLICGIPNVGKSTLINRLAGKRAAKTGDEAGITKLEQRIALSADFYLYDTPGMLWPRIIVAQSGYNLAASGAVGRNAYDDEEVALALADYLKAHYADLVQTRFKLTLSPQTGGEELLESIGRQRGALLGKGRVNMQKAAEILIHEFRGATLGRITLETPAQYLQWLAEGKLADAERAAKKNKVIR